MVVQLGKYQHSKTGNFYRVIAVAKHSETREEVVVYECLYKNSRSRVWVRPKKMFMETVVIKRKEVPRFRFVGE